MTFRFRSFVSSETIECQKRGGCTLLSANTTRHHNNKNPISSWNWTLRTGEVMGENRDRLNKQGIPAFPAEPASPNLQCYGLQLFTASSTIISCDIYMVLSQLQIMSTTLLLHLLLCLLAAAYYVNL